MIVVAIIVTATAGVLALAPREGLGVTNPEKRARHVDAINRFRGV